MLNICYLIEKTLLSFSLTCVLVCVDHSASCCVQLQVESVLDKDIYSLEELLDEDEIIQECKALNSRLITL